MPRDPITFDSNTPVRVTFESAGGREYPSLYGDRLRTMYSLEGNRVLWADPELAVKINFCEPKAGESLWITKRQQWVGTGKKRHRTTEWQVSAGEPGVVQRRNEYPDTQANAQATGIPESDLERELRESREMVQARAANRAQARENVARMPVPPASYTDAVEATLATDAPAIARKPPEVAVAAAPAAPQNASARPSWYVALVSQTKDLVDALAEVRLHAERHGQRVSFDDCEKLLVTSLIGKQRQRA